MELSELLEFQRDPFLCTSPIINNHGGKSGAAIFRSIPVGVMKASLNEVKEDRGFREAFAHERFHFGWMRCLGPSCLNFLAKLRALVNLEAFLYKRKKQKDIHLNSLSSSCPLLNDEEKAAMDFGLESLSIFERVYINPPPWDPSAAGFQTQLSMAPDPFYRESFRVLRSMMARLMDAFGIKDCFWKGEGLSLIGRILTAGPLPPLLRQPEIKIGGVSPRSHNFLIRDKESRFSIGLIRTIRELSKHPFTDSVMYLNKLNDNPELTEVYATQYGAVMDTIREMEEVAAFSVKRRLHERKKEGDGTYLLPLCLWFAEALLNPNYQIDNTFEVDDLNRSIDISNFEDSSISNRQGMIFLLSNGVIRSFQNPYQEIGELFDPNSVDRVSWLDVLFSDWIRNWAEKGGLLTCPMVYAQEKLSCFDRGCPLCQEKVIPSESNAYCIQEGGVSLSKIRDRKCLFWDVFSAIFDGYEKVTHES